MVTIQIVLISLLSIWLLSFIYSISYFLKNKPNSLDLAFHNQSKTFDEARNDLTILEKFKKKEFNSAKRKIDFYEENARLTKRKYIYYAERIEVGYIGLFLGRTISRKDVFNKLDKPVKLHFIFILGLIISFALLSISVFLFKVIYTPSEWLIVTFSVIILILVKFYIYFISINCALYYIFLNLILYLAKVDRSKLFKNTAILDFLTKNWRGFDHSGMLIGAAAVGSFHSYGGNGYGGDFAGGSFGGGGAGGSW